MKEELIKYAFINKKVFLIENFTFFKLTVFIYYTNIGNNKYLGGNNAYIKGENAMVAQLFIGIYFVVKGIVELYSRKPNYFLSEGTIQSIPKENLSSYLKSIGAVHILIGIIVAMMGQIEYWYNPNLWIFIIAYIMIVFAFLGILLYLNKKYSGNYILR
ncbi:hypothetical protein ACLIA0_14475 [Bacillaceae bacterium W0354]